MKPLAWTEEDKEGGNLVCYISPNSKGFKDIGILFSDGDVHTHIDGDVHTHQDQDAIGIGIIFA